MRRADVQRTLNLLQSRRPTEGGRLAQLHNLATTGYAAYQVGEALWKRWNGRTDDRDMTVIIPDDDELFRVLNRWLMEQVPVRSMRSIQAFTRVPRGENSWRDFVPRELLFSSADGEEHQVRIGSHSIRVKYQPPSVSADSEGKPGSVVSGRTRRGVREGGQGGSLVFTARTPEGMEAIQRFLREQNAQMNESYSPGSSTLTATAWGTWERLEGEPRDLETVILREGVKEGLVADIEQFLDLRTRYQKLGIPRHRGYLLHGPPGTGKTSVIRGLSSHFKMDLYCVSLADMNKDADIAIMLNRVEPNSIILLEDIDAVEATVVRGSREHKALAKQVKRAGITLTGILNSLDGAVTPKDVIIMMTTNHPERLDPALRRAGRIDRDVQIDNLDYHQLSRMCALFLEEDVPTDLPRDVARLSIAPVELIELFKRNLDRPDSVHVLDDVRTFIKQREIDESENDQQHPE